MQLVCGMKLGHSICSLKHFFSKLFPKRCTYLKFYISLVIPFIFYCQ